MSEQDDDHARWRSLGLLSSEEEAEESADDESLDEDENENDNIPISPTHTPASTNNAAPAPHVPDLGYRPPDGVVYAQPREPFVRTYWDGAENMFRRNDVNDTRRHGKPPNGWVFVPPPLTGFRRTREQTEADEARLSAAENARSARDNQVFFGPDTPNGTMLEISIYVGALGHHAPLAWWGFLISALTALCNHRGSAAAMSKERGDRRRLLHYQIVLRIITLEMYKELLRKFIKQRLNILPNGNVRCKIGISYFKDGQTWPYMLGYVQKDQGQPHYELWTKEVTGAELINGRQQYELVSLCFRSPNRTRSDLE